MWYVVKVRAGAEEDTQKKCLERIPSEVLESCSLFYYEEMHRYGGKWTMEQRIFLPGYLFVDTSKLQELKEQLQKSEEGEQLFEEEPLPLTTEEEALLQSLGGKENLIRMSEGIIEKSKLTVLSGPLQGKEGLIRKIDRHKRRAYLEVPMFGETQMVRAGLEVKSKTV